MFLADPATVQSSAPICSHTDRDLNRALPLESFRMNSATSVGCAVCDYLNSKLRFVVSSPSGEQVDADQAGDGFAHDWNTHTLSFI